MLEDSVDQQGPIYFDHGMVICESWRGVPILSTEAIVDKSLAENLR